MEPWVQPRRLAETPGRPPPIAGKAGRGRRVLGTRDSRLSIANGRQVTVPGIRGREAQSCVTTALGRLVPGLLDQRQRGRQPQIDGGIDLGGLDRLHAARGGTIPLRTWIDRFYLQD